jgi:hypothetical protein
MKPWDRYDELRNALLREEPLGRSRWQGNELELQAHWFAGDFGREFVTTAGQRVRIVQFGTWNREAGPDFAEAAVAFDDGETQRGCIELDPDARDWEHHGHATNPDYTSVVLHIFTRHGGPEFFTRTSDHRQVPQVLLDPTRLGADLPANLPEARLGRCAGPFRDLPEDKASDVLRAAAQFRLRRKSAALARLADLHGPDEALFQALATTLGYKSNKLPFALLAQRLPLRLLRKGDADALLFGVSGFLPHDLAAFDASTRSYLRELWERWWPRRAEFERLAIAPTLWRLSGQRPANHPQRRLGALAQLIRHWPKIRALSERGESLAVHEFFAGLKDEYWDFHYTITSKQSARPMALVGESRVIEMLANVFFPLALARDEAHWADFKKLRAPLANQRAEVAALRLFGPGPRKEELLKSVALQQGLLQIYEDFCLRDATDCAQCLFPRQLAKW